MPILSIRPATQDDLAAMLAIYAPYVTDTTISFEVVPPTPAEFAARFARISADFPWLVCERGGQILGYTYASRFGERRGFDWTAETSVYLHPAAQGQGVGAALNRALCGCMAAQGYRTLYARIVAPNAQSEGFHARQGFEKQALLRNVGNKFGRWLDVAFYAKALLPYTENPTVPVAFRALARDEVDKICQEAAGL